MKQLTSKELSTIEDQLHLEENLVSKFRNYAQVTNDATLKNKYEQIAKKHEEHYFTLYSYLKA